jgi:hypothetical protein
MPELNRFSHQSQSKPDFHIGGCLWDHVFPFSLPHLHAQRHHALAMPIRGLRLICSEAYQEMFCL